jgi:O-antigen/teichoic acid export membrane protein
MHLRVILRNIFSNWASYLVTAVIGFLLAPVVVHSLGNTGYGLWTLVVSLTGYFGLLDLGIRSSVGRFVVRYLALNDEDNVNRTASTAFAILAAGGTLALLATLIVVNFLFGNFKVEPQFMSAGKTALLITGVNMSCILPLSIFSAVHWNDMTS